METFASLEDTTTETKMLVYSTPPTAKHGDKN
jgi:hypothetical protein